MGIVPKWGRTFIECSESDKSLKHELSQFKETLCDQCLPGIVVASLSPNKT